MGQIGELLRVYEYLTEKAERNNFIVDTAGTKHGATKLDRRTTKEKHTREWLRERRRKVVELYDAGLSASDIAAQIGCARSLVYAAAATHRQVRLHAS